MPTGLARARAFAALLTLSGVCLTGVGYLNGRAFQNTVPAAGSPTPSVSAIDIRHTLDEYCVTCHKAG